MQTLYGLFGNPEDVAESHTLLKQPAMLLRTWLRVAEALMRRLLILEAAAFLVPPPSRRHAGKMPAVRTRKLRYFYPDKPQDWRVSFRCFRSVALRQAQGDAEWSTTGPVSVSLSLSKAKRPAPKRFFDAWPLAERYEAILRVFNNPIPYARRLAKRLYAQPHRLKEVMRPPADAHHKIGDEDWAELARLCERTRCFADSS